MVLPRRGVVIERPRGSDLAVGMRRFADGFVGLIPVKTPPGKASFLRAPPDAEPRRPWHFEIGLSGSALVCAVSA